MKSKRKFLTFMACLSLGFGLLAPLTGNTIISNPIQVSASDGGSGNQNTGPSNGGAGSGFSGHSTSEVGVKLTFYISEDKDLITKYNDREVGVEAWTKQYGDNQQVIKQTIFLLNDKGWNIYNKSGNNVYSLASYYRHNINPSNSETYRNILTFNEDNSFYKKSDWVSSIGNGNSGNLVNLKNNSTNNINATGNNWTVLKASDYDLEDFASNYCTSSSTTTNTISATFKSFEGSNHTGNLDNFEDPTASKVLILLKDGCKITLPKQYLYTVYIEPMVNYTGTNGTNVFATGILASKCKNLTYNLAPSGDSFRKCFETNVAVNDMPILGWNEGEINTANIPKYLTSDGGAVFHVAHSSSSSEDKAPQMPSIPVYEKYSDGSYSEPITYLTMNQNTWKDIKNIIDYAQRNSDTAPSQTSGSQLNNFDDIVKGAESINIAQYELTVDANDSKNNSGISQKIIEDSGKNYTTNYALNYTTLLSFIKNSLESSVFSVDSLKGNTVASQSGYSTVIKHQTGSTEEFSLTGLQDKYGAIMQHKTPNNLLIPNLKFENGQKYTLTGKNAKIYFAGDGQLMTETNFGSYVGGYENKGTTIKNSELFQNPYSYAVVIEVGNELPQTQVPNFVFNYNAEVEDDEGNKVAKSASENLTIPYEVTMKTGLMLEYCVNTDLKLSGLETYLNNSAEAVKSGLTGLVNSKLSADPSLKQKDISEDTEIENALLDYFFNTNNSALQLTNSGVTAGSSLDAEKAQAIKDLRTIHDVSKLKTVLEEYFESIEKEDLWENYNSSGSAEDLKKLEEVVLTGQATAQALINNTNVFIGSPTTYLKNVFGLDNVTSLADKLTNYLARLNYTGNIYDFISENYLETYTNPETGETVLRLNREKMYNDNANNSVGIGICSLIGDCLMNSYNNYTIPITIQLSDGTTKTINVSFKDCITENGNLRNSTIQGNFLALNLDADNNPQVTSYNYSYFTPVIVDNSIAINIMDKLIYDGNYTSSDLTDSSTLINKFLNDVFITMVTTQPGSFYDKYLDAYIDKSYSNYDWINNLETYLYNNNTQQYLFYSKGLQDIGKMNEVLGKIKTSVINYSNDTDTTFKEFMDSDILDSSTLSDMYTQAYLLLSKYYDYYGIVNVTSSSEEDINSALTNYTSASYTGKDGANTKGARTKDIPSTYDEINLNFNLNTADGEIDVNTAVPFITERSVEYVLPDMNYDTHGESNTPVNWFNQQSDGLAVYFAGNTNKDTSVSTELNPGSLQNGTAKSLSNYKNLTNKYIITNSKIIPPYTSISARCAMTPLELKSQVNNKMTASTSLTIGDVLRYPYSWGISNSPKGASDIGTIYTWQMNKTFSNTNSVNLVINSLPPSDKITNLNLTEDDTSNNESTNINTRITGGTISWQISKRFGWSTARSCTLTSIPTIYTPTPGIVSSSINIPLPKNNSSYTGLISITGPNLTFSTGLNETNGTINSSSSSNSTLRNKATIKLNTGAEIPLLNMDTTVLTGEEAPGKTVGITGSNNLYYSEISTDTNNTDMGNNATASRYTVTATNAVDGGSGIIDLTKCYFMSYRSNGNVSGKLNVNPVPVVKKTVQVGGIDVPYITYDANGYYDQDWKGTEVPCNQNNTLKYKSSYKLTMDYGGYIELDANYSTDLADSESTSDGVPVAKAGQTIKGIIKNNVITISAYCILPNNSAHNLPDVKSDWVKGTEGLRWKSQDEFIQSMGELVEDISHSDLEVASTIYGLSTYNDTLAYKRVSLGDLANSENDVTSNADGLLLSTNSDNPVLTGDSKTIPIYPSKITNLADDTGAGRIHDMNNIDDVFTSTAVETLNQGLTIRYDPQSTLNKTDLMGDTQGSIANCNDVWYNEYSEGLQVVHYTATIDFGDKEFTFTIDKRDSDFRDTTNDVFFNAEKSSLIDNWKNTFNQYSILTKDEVMPTQDDIDTNKINLEDYFIKDADGYRKFGIEINEDANTFMPVIDLSGLKDDNKKLLPIGNDENTSTLNSLAGHQTQLHIRGSIYDNT